MAFPIGQILGDVGGLGLSAATGGELPPSLGMSIGGGLGEMIQGGLSKPGTTPPLTDPAQAAQLGNYQNILNDLKTRKHNLDTGVMYKPEQEEIKEVGQSALNQVSKVTGGNVGASVSAMNLVNRGTGRNLGKLFSNMSKESGDVTMEGLKVNEMMSNLVDTMAQRKLNIQMYQKQQAYADKRRLESQGIQQILGGLAGGSGKFDDWFKGLFNKNTPNVNTTSSNNYGIPASPYFSTPTSGDTTQPIPDNTGDVGVNLG